MQHPRKSRHLGPPSGPRDAGGDPEGGEIFAW
jgi:hypothetical protein